MQFDLEEGVKYLKDVRRINDNVLPILYGDLFYSKVKRSEPIVIKISYGDKCVGGLLAFKDNTNYIIATLCVYTKYQGMKCGTLLLNRFIEIIKTKDIKVVQVQVQTTNETALTLYMKHGFIQIKEVPKAYPSLKCSSAYLLQLNL
ncbi:N-acetyltransferase separation anxiety, putative [Entamoeba invadens IP1]|uniref:N-acetyltransferase separation anxiety, putative n=1 Tax=Entamoeba invadens IP1 TaxID=370355 RepID=A0A0A1TYT3_ENTIV|nr:N-acetyltransferase separation anxiety, putative [Entamoeba invadens IP1]ELP83691.1 N-acetyltransferase separation anxiety, putative [Entamoeba invadens IP1]|eukprot:XP_004183037.1 N-acetyltransferase separation anxiety, putative [Entamoeba invadens IP1]